MVKIIRMQKSDIPQAARIASQCFSGMQDSRKARQWITCNFEAFPRMRYFVAKKDMKVVGYILWLEKGGFRKEAVLELEQIAVAPACQGQGIGTLLIKKSLAQIKTALKKRGAKLKLIETTTGTDNQAQELYKKALKARPVCTIKNLFRGNEVFMVARF